MKLIGITGNAGAGKDTAADHLIAKYGYVRVALADPLKRFAKEVYGFTDDQLWGPSSSRNAPDKRYVRTTHERHSWVAKDATKDVKEMEWVCEHCGATGGENPASCITYLTPRYALQILGTEWGRNCYQNTWIELAIRTAAAINEGGMSYTPQRGLFEDKTLPRPTGVVITDVRFWNELSGIRDAGGSLWRIKNAKPANVGENWRQHKSETEQGEIPDDRFDVLIVNNKVAFEVLYGDVDAAYAKILSKAA